MANSSGNPPADDRAGDSLRQRLGASLAAHSPAEPGARYVVAYSGGIDSHVLLHACTALALDVRAIHVNHHLQAHAGAWQQHCAEVCDRLGVAFEAVGVEVDTGNGASPEAAAREARYRALLAALRPGEVLLLGQHRDDQAETVLLQLMRGAGPAGLAAMPAHAWPRAGAGVMLLRPLLDCSREDILAYARAQGLGWVDDPSNYDTAIRRNALRHEVLPVFRQHWPGAARQLATVAGQQQQAAELLDDLARLDLADSAGDDPAQLHIEPLAGLTPARRFNLLRYWLHRLGASPNRKCIQQIISDIMPAADDACPHVAWSDFEVRRYDQRLYLLPRRPPDAPGDLDGIAWTPAEPLHLPQTGQRIAVVRDVAAGLHNRYLGVPLSVRFRHGGERIVPRGHAHHHSLKKLFQQAHVPPWERARVPLFYAGEALLAVGAYWLADEHCVGPDQFGWRPVITGQAPGTAARETGTTEREPETTA